MVIPTFHLESLIMESCILLFHYLGFWNLPLPLRFSTLPFILPTFTLERVTLESGIWNLPCPSLHCPTLRLLESGIWNLPHLDHLEEGSGIWNLEFGCQRNWNLESANLESGICPASLDCNRILD